MMINKTKNKIISKKEKYCKDAFSQGWGLMFSRRKNLVMEFPEERETSLHMWFVFYPINVLVLDESKRIENELIGLLSRSKDKNVIGILNYSLANNYYSNNQYALALEHFLKGEKVFEELNDLNMLASTYNQMGWMLESLNMQEKAIDRRSRIRP